MERHDGAIEIEVRDKIEKLKELEGNLGTIKTGADGAKTILGEMRIYIDAVQGSEKGG